MTSTRIPRKFNLGSSRQRRRRAPVSPYHDRLDQCLEAVEAERIVSGECVLPEGTTLQWDTAVPYGGTATMNYELALYKGRATQKYLHVTIWRSNTGRYEVNSYVL